ncbi:MAG: glutamine--fructose-6-phosphate transaminase (isomerizing) [Clostridia bacterium]|nr:glutamine--fructose-6-phosphate transaminase (isomerizing) [Clostridia bacterium]
MCGIIGYTGDKSAQQIIIESLHALEYRGYDSAGMSLFTSEGIRTLKTQGRVDELDKKAKEYDLNQSNCGIGHTRWATHGKPNETNAHPHGTQKLMIVHNGIIENYKELKKILIKKGCVFVSDTDTEVIAHLLDMNYTALNDKIKAITQTVKMLKGSYALSIIFRDEPNTVYGVKKDSPLLVGVGKGENFLASDISAFIAHTENYLRPEDGETVKITPYEVDVFNAQGKKTEKPLQKSANTAEDTDKCGFNHYMLKEIFEEPKVLLKTLDSLTCNFLPCFNNENDLTFFEDIGSIRIIACGTAMHSGLVGKFYIEKYARIPVTVEVASEFRYSDPILDEKDLVIIISQSGETADSLAALRLVNEMKLRTLSIVNTPGSTIARESEYVIHTPAGPEIAVASTKAFSVQTLVLMLLALRLSGQNNEFIKERIKSLYSTVTDSLHNVITDTAAIRSAAKILAKHRNLFFIGRGCDNYLGTEGSLKLKEISYIHSEAYAAGELKHGTISLIENGTPVIALVTDDAYSEKMRSNIEEVKSRGGYIISVCAESCNKIKDVSDINITVPEDDTFARPLTAAAVLQLLAYYTALELGRDIDKPRNLAKSVTVE